MVVGGNSAQISTAYFGNGVTNSTPSPFTLTSTGGSGTDIAGASLTLAAGPGTGSGGSGSLLFQTASPAASGASANTLATRMAISPVGNVGIGTPNPSSTLQVSAADTHTTLMIENRNSSAARYPHLDITNYAGSTAGHSYLGMVHARGSSVAPAATQGNDTLGRLIFAGYDGAASQQSSSIDVVTEGAFSSSTNIPSSMRFLTGSTSAGSVERMRITAAGNLGIGTSTPASKLQVNGGIAAGFVTVSYSATPTFDAALGNTFKITLTGNVTSSTLVNAVAGQILIFIICQDATGSRSFVWPSSLKFDNSGMDNRQNYCNISAHVFDGTNGWQLGMGISKILN